ncbi:MAG: TetR family transcriptional regulator [Chloroflexi bacterium]|nr:TetR family transcriptional regulator [Chloroflexota bacterium]OJV89554.1 MAG: hypothetical protein BGO39_36950 [Chloroflexi bacterium 54-19]
MRRAIKDTQKQERQQNIIETASQLFAQGSYQMVTLEAVAEKVGVARGTLYLYFKTREELFMALLEQTYRAWATDVTSGLEELLTHTDHRPSIIQVTQLLSESLLKHWTATRLVALLPSVLEHNVEFEAALRFKQMLLTQGAKVTALLHEALPFLSPKQAGQLLPRITVLIVGLLPHTEPSPVLREVLTQPGMEVFHMNFQQEFNELLCSLLYGLQRQSELKSQAATP